MKFLVVSCIERDINLEAVCGTKEEANEKMKECFLEFHRTCGYSEESVDSMKSVIEFTDNLETGYFGYHVGDHAWSNEVDEVHYDIKILEIE